MGPEWELINWTIVALAGGFGFCAGGGLAILCRLDAIWLNEEIVDLCRAEIEAEKRYGVHGGGSGPRLARHILRVVERG